MRVRERSQTNGEGGSRNVSGETLVDRTGDVAQQPVRESVQILDSKPNVDAMSGDDLKKPRPAEQMKRRKSTRLELVQRATNVVSATTTALGKRGREVINAGKEKIHGMKLDRRASLRPRGLGLPAETTIEGPTKKRTRFADGGKGKTDTVVVKSSPTKSPKPRVKRWLSQGLYVGQDRDFDPRLTDAKNKMKKASKTSATVKENKVMPLPMFGGQRLLDTGRDFKLPFNVFSPLPPGQPKPEEWKKTQKSNPPRLARSNAFANPFPDVFVGDAANIWKNNKRREHSTCICTPESGCDEDCFNRLMFYECDDSNCSIGAEHCTNRSFEDLRKRCKAGGRYNIGVEVIKTADRGYGVRSNRTFEPNQIIVEYAGEIITQDECEERMMERYKDNEVRFTHHKSPIHVLTGDDSATTSCCSIKT